MNVEVGALKPSKADILAERDTDLGVSLSLDALIRSIGVRRTSPVAFFLGAGASTTSGIPSAQMCVWEWKRRIFLTNNPGLEEQFTEISLVEVKRRIQRWLDRQIGFPKEGAPEEYGFYIQQCFPIEDDRRAYFQDLVRNASPYVGYKLLCQLTEAELVRSVWSPNFDSLTARTAGGYKLSPVEVGIDTTHHLRAVKKGEVLCVSLHGDYRYDKLMNTPAELQKQEDVLRKALIAEVKETSLVVSGYSGRDASLMDALGEGYSQPGGGVLYWCGISDEGPSPEVEALVRHARTHGRQAYYVSTFGFDDLLTRVSLHVLEGQARKDAEKALEQFVTSDKTARTAWQVPKPRASTLIKSNAFAIECPSEMLCFDLKVWPEKAWSGIRTIIEARDIVAVPFKGKVCALGRMDDIKDVFKDNIKGTIERTPVAPGELAFEDGAITSLMRDALTRVMAQIADLSTDGRNDLWERTQRSDQSKCKPGTVAYDSVQLHLRRLGNVQYLALMPSIKVLDKDGLEIPLEIANPIKLAILGYQHNKQFNQAVMRWRETLLPGKPDTTYEFPLNCGSTFRFKIKRSPVFGEIGLGEGKPTKIPDKMRHLVKYDGIELKEPELVFSNKAGTGLVRSRHPVRGIVENKPFDFPLTAKGFFSGLRVGIVCAGNEATSLHRYLQNAHKILQPSKGEQDYLVNYPGFQQAFGVPIEFPEPGGAGWFVCPEPNSTDAQTSTLEIAGHINRGIEQLQSVYAPHVVLVFYPTRWSGYRGYRTESERFDVHDFVKAFCVQRGIATQFLNEDTLADDYQCRVWWWLSLALYVKAMRTPWVLNSLAENTAFVGLGFSIDHSADRDRHVVLGCSHIYSGRGEGLQYRLSKIEDPIIRGKNAFMSKEDARRTGETIRQLFFDARLKLPERVVLHKRTHFTTKEREGLAEGLSGVKQLDMLEIQIDNVLRYVASVPTPEGSFDDDNFPVRRGTVMKLDDFTALLWVHGATTALHPRSKYFQGKRRIPAPLTIRRHAGHTGLQNISEEILGLSKMNWNTFDLYTKLPATIHSSNQIARIGSLLQRFGTASYDYRLFI
jgi:hypothetical protein